MESKNASDKRPKSVLDRNLYDTEATNSILEIGLALHKAFFWVFPCVCILYADVSEHCLFHLPRQVSVKNDVSKHCPIFIGR
jgi:hypothetical protein